MTRNASGDWRPGATLEVLRLRARMLAAIRAFFSAHGVLEVETPILSPAATPDPALESFETTYSGPGAPRGRTLYLHTSPEFPMKRLLAAGSGSIYQICRVFRNGESGRQHNPEFTMIEWYRVGFDHHALMDEVAELVSSALGNRVSLAPAERITYQEAFERHIGINPHTATAAELARTAARHNIDAPSLRPGHDEHAVWRDLLLSHLIEPQLGRGRLTFLYDFPASQASLARILPGPPPVAARFELYLSGVELANGFHELADADEQFTRFERQLHARQLHALPKVPLDERFLAALRHGLPECAGVALGFDRLVMLAAAATSIDQVIAFPLDRT